MERWGREALTFVAAARRRAEAPFTSTMRSGNGGASDGPTCSPTTPMISIASPPRSGFIARRIRGRRARRSPTTTAYERRRALAHGAIACSREEIVAVVRRMRSSCAARGAETGS